HFAFRLLRRHPRLPLFPYTTLFRSVFTHLVRLLPPLDVLVRLLARVPHRHPALLRHLVEQPHHLPPPLLRQRRDRDPDDVPVVRSEEHTSELQSRENLVCRLLLEKK